MIFELSMRIHDSLFEENPDLAKEWHPTKNGNLTPCDVSASSGRKVWWKISYYDEKSDKSFDFEWQSTVNNRANGVGCPYLSGMAKWPEYNM